VDLQNGIFVLVFRASYQLPAVGSGLYANVAGRRSSESGPGVSGGAGAVPIPAKRTSGWATIRYYIYLLVYVRE
jgi:hypothetical protein